MMNSIILGPDEPSYLERNALTIIEEYANTHSEFIFLEHGAIKITYAEFWYRARKMASYLANKNIKANKLVGIYLDKSINQWIILVAIWIIGSYYLPLDKRWSLPKLKKLLDDAQCDVIITEAEQEIYTYSSHINIDAIDFLEMPLAEITHHEAAYMIATSGSTGNPKLSIITHAAFTNMAMAIKDILQTPSQCRILQYSPLCFDASIIEFGICIVAGATLVIPDSEKSGAGVELSNLIIRKKIELSLLPPSIATTLNDDALKCIRCIILGGESINATLINRLLKFVTVYNAYGLSEATCVSTFKKIENSTSELNCIGKPIANVTLSIVDEKGNIVPKNHIGEIKIHGISVGRPHKLNIQNPCPPLKTSSSLKLNSLLTGDLGIMSSSGEIKFLGRNDDQIKRFGNRFSIEDVQFIVCKIENILDCRVVIKKSQSEEKIIAFIITSCPISNETLFNSFKKLGASYMCPNQFIIISEFPLTENGKIDNLALLSILSTQEMTPRENQEDSFENHLISTWCKVLNYSSTEFSMNDNFFEKGGDSLAAIELSGEISSSLKINFDTLDVFDYQRIDSLIQHTKTLKKKEQSLHLTTSQENIPKKTKFCSRQQHLWEKTKNQKDNRVIFHFNLSSSLLDYEKFKSCFNVVYQRHELLRSIVRFYDNNGFFEESNKSLVIEEFDLRGQSLDNIDVIIEDMYNNINSDVFDPENNPLFKVYLLRISKKQIRVFFSIYHLISDATSLEIIWKSVCSEYYNKFITGQSKFFQYLEKENMYFNSQNFKLDKEYFTNISNQCSLIETNENIIFSSEEIEVDLTKYNLLLNECAKKIGCTVYAILLTSFIFVMQEIFQNKNICIGLPITMRTDSFFENMIGPFNTRLPFFYSYNDKISFLDNCNYCFAALKELRSHVFFPHNELTKIKPKWYSIVFDMESLIEIVDSIIIQQLPIPDNNVMSHHVFARVHKSKDSMKLNFRCRLDLVSQNKRSDIVEKYISVMHVFLEDYLGR